ncbi:antichymotrypsin-2 [Papilio machaon]|uniref:antichymotrypsin-2 n=1 Tax=Papilio machaon TaxID=76193 RepID=UPI001E664BB0|nr:antichymotrypsin-2 [Papilio machaon]
MKCIILTLLAVVAMAYCNQDTALLLNGNIKFTTKLFSEIAKSNTNKSFVISAFSVLTPLAQLSLGAEGGTHDELLTAIGLPNDQSTKSAFTDMKTKLGSLKGAELRMANRIYVTEKYSVSKDYAAMTRQIFDSEVTSADFTQPEKTATEINKWVEDHTNHRIKNLVDPKDLQDIVVILVNSIYFQSAWQTPFPKVSTMEQNFHVTNHKTVKVPMMRKFSQYKYVNSEELNSAIIELPYVGNNSALYIILPNDVEGITQLKDKLNNTSILENALQEMQLVHIEVQIPRFTIETRIDLKKTLPHVGVEKIFKIEESNLSKIVNGRSNNLYVGQASQKAFVEVNEEGTAAGAANEFKLLLTSPLVQKYFIADRPFVFDIRINNAPMFRGIYTAT